MPTPTRTRFGHLGATVLFAISVLCCSANEVRAPDVSSPADSDDTTPSNDADDQAPLEGDEQQPSADSDARVDLVPAEGFSTYIAESFKLFWYYPARAYPGLALVHQFVAYEAFNQPLQWTLPVAPARMTIGANDGVLRWDPQVSELGTHPVTVRVTTASGDYLEKAFVISVNTEEFVFVSQQSDAADSNTGALDSPLRTVRAALSKISSGEGKTIYVRGGTYTEYTTLGNELRISGSHSEAAPVVLSGFPGETNFVLDCDQQGWGFELTGTYSVLQNAVIENAYSPYDRGGIVVWGNYNALEAVTVRNTNFRYTENCAGILVNNVEGVFLDRVVATANYDRQSQFHNSSNYLFYTEYLADAPFAKGPIHVLNSYSSDSIVGFKLKHPGSVANVIVHNCVSENDELGYAIDDDTSSIRYSIAKNSSSYGIFLGGGDNYPESQGTMLIEHNTIIDSGSAAIAAQNNYVQQPVILKNIIYQSSQIPVGSYVANEICDTPSLCAVRFIDLWHHQADVSSTSARVSKNVYFASSAIVRASDFYRGTNAYTSAQWQDLDYDSDSVFADPLFADDAYTLSSASPAVFSGGEFAGAR